MRPGNFVYFLREALNSLSRNRLLTIATISTVSICVLILGMAVLLTVNAGNIMNHLESEVEVVAYLDTALTESQVADLKDEISDIAGVDEVTFVSKDEGLKKLQKSIGADEYNLAATIGKNPLPHRYEIKAEDPHDVPAIAAKIGKLYGINKVRYGEGVVERLFEVTKWIRVISLVIIVLLAFGAVFLIATTIRLAIFARRKEIYLMKLIGATDWFIRWPFFIEGIILGSLGALLSIVILAAAYGSLVKHMEAVFFLPLVTGSDVVIILLLSLLAAGAVLGVLGTLVSVNRFLDV